MTDNRSYATFEEWAKGLRFGLGVEDETADQVRKVAKSAFEAGGEPYKSALEAISQSPHASLHCDLKAIADDALKGK